MMTIALIILASLMCFEMIYSLENELIGIGVVKAIEILLFVAILLPYAK